jgi:hypothetical protein
MNANEASKDNTTQVRVLVFHRDRPGTRGNDTVDLTDHRTEVADAPALSDYAAWTAWVREYAGKWLAMQEPLAPGSYRALAVNPAVKHFAGFEGYRCLSQEIELIYVTP